jgi:hypothetical protein
MVTARTPARNRSKARAASSRSALAIPLDTAPMEAKLVDSLPTGEGWQFEPKMHRLDAQASTSSAHLRF